MPLLTDVRDAACAHLQSSLKNALRVEAFAGVLNLDGLAPRGVQYSEKAALFIAAGECRNVGPALYCDFEASFWVFSVARHAARPTIAASAALALAQDAALAIHGQRFGLTGVSPANVRSLAPIIDDDLDKAGIHAFELRFDMRVALSADLGRNPS